MYAFFVVVALLNIIITNICLEMEMLSPLEVYRRMFEPSFKKLVLRRGRLSGVRWMIVAPDNNNLRLLRRTLRTLLLVHHECLMLMNNKTLTLSGAGAALSPEFSKNILH